MSEKRRDSKGRVLRDREIQRSDGMYMYRYMDLQGNRKAVYSWRLVKTDKVPEGKKDTPALREMEKLIQRDLDDKIQTGEAEKTTVDHLFYRFLDLRTDLREATRCNYSGLYKKHAQAIIGHRSIRSIKSTEIQALYTKMITETKVKISTVQKLHVILYGMFELAVMDDLLRYNPTKTVMRRVSKRFDEEQSKRHALARDEQTNLMDYVRQSPEFSKWESLFTVLFGTGMRIGEALGLRWCDCNFDEGLISVNHGILYKPTIDGGYQYRISKPKTKAGYRVIPMFAEVKDALLHQKEMSKRAAQHHFTVDGYTGFIFLNKEGKVYTPAYVYDVIQRITQSYNREAYFMAEKEDREPYYLPKISAHIFRHTFCTRLCEQESNIKVVQDIMGHRNFSTTMDIYTDVTRDKKVDVFKNLEGKMNL